MYNTDKYDFSAFGRAIKAARKQKGWTREQLAEMLDLAPRYIMSIENKGQHPSLQVFHDLITRFNISADEYFYPGSNPKKTTRRRQLDALLDELCESDLIILTETAHGIQKAKQAEQ